MKKTKNYKISLQKKKLLKYVFGGEQQPKQTSFQSMPNKIHSEG